MADQCEYRVEVTGTEVTGTFVALDGAASTYGPSPLRPTAEQRETIRVLQQWLNRWTAVRTHNLPVPGTFEVLGKHLHDALLSGTVGEGFRLARERAAQSGTTLRLLLEFRDDAEDFAYWPWELLHDTGLASTGEFLGQASRLVLSRRLGLDERVTPPGPPPLHVYSIIAVPDTPGYRKQRAQLVEALNRPTEYSSSLQVEVVERWDLRQVRKRLGQPPYPHVVHIAGVCKRVWQHGAPALRVCLDDGAGAEKWTDPRVLLGMFADNQELAVADQVRLVVLHLCEPSPLDYEVTFERLAPALLRQHKVPAVLAMQYPLTGEPASTFIQWLYEGLADRKSIEEAVHDARAVLYEDYEQDLLFGSPVLYLQTRDGHLLRDTAAMPAIAEAGPASAGPTPGPGRRPVADVLAGLLWSQEKRSVDAQQAAYEQVTATTWSEDWTDVEPRLSQLVRQNAHTGEVAALFADLLQAVRRLRREGRDA